MPNQVEQFKAEMRCGVVGPYARWDEHLQEVTELRERADSAQAALAQDREGLEEALEDREFVDEELTMIALALKNQGIEGVTPERGVELLIERLYHQRLSTPERERLLEIAAGIEDLGGDVDAEDKADFLRLLATPRRGVERQPQEDES